MTTTPWFRLAGMALVLALTVIAPLPGQARQAAGAPPLWGQYMYNGAHNAYNPAETALGAGNVAKLKPVWKAPLFGGMVEANGLVYAGELSKGMFAWSAKTGKVVWNYASSYAGGEVVAGNSLIFWTAVNGKTAPIQLVSVDAATGKLRWSYSGSGPRSGPGAMGVTDGQTVVMEGPDSAKSLLPTSIYAFDVASGQLLWRNRYKTGQLQSIIPAMAGGSVFVPIASSLQALDARTGQVQWTYGVSKNDLAINPIVSNGSVYVVDGTANAKGVVQHGTLDILDAATGKVQATWAPASGVYLTRPCAVVSNTLYFTGFTATAKAYTANVGAYDLGSRTLRWNHTVQGTDGSNGPMDVAAVANGVVYAGGYALDAGAGAVLWKARAAFGVPSVSGGQLFTEQGAYGVK